MLWFALIVAVYVSGVCLIAYSGARADPSAFDDDGFNCGMGFVVAVAWPLILLFSPLIGLVVLVQYCADRGIRAHHEVDGKDDSNGK